MRTPIQPVIAIHGGAGTITHTADHQSETPYHLAMQDVLGAAEKLLGSGGSALDAVSLAVAMLEDCPLFNAGYGAVFTHDVTHELDAAIMDGATLRAGAVACISRVRHPVHAARTVMERSDHVLLVGVGAERFAQGCGLEMVDPSFFSTAARREQLTSALRTDTSLMDHDAASLVFRPFEDNNPPLDETRKFGTVGAVALDAQGNLAAATSTGGMTNKRCGRVGDSPLVGAGTYAHNRTAAISCTGTGEMFMRTMAAYDVCARMAYGGQSLQAAAHAVIMQTLPAISGCGGLIAVDALGNVVMPFNTTGMYRGHARVGQKLSTAIFQG